MEPGMPNDNPIEHNWKSRLGDVSGLRGEILTDKNATWEKLHSRLSKKPRPSKGVWYWAAAACLLLAFILPMMMREKMQGTVVKNSPEKIQVKSSKSPVTSPKDNTAEITSVSSTPSIETIKLPEQVINKRSSVKTKIREKNVELKSKKYKVNIDEPTILSSAIIDTITTIAVVPVTKKLRVVHINELDPHELTTDVARHHKHP